MTEPLLTSGFNCLKQARHGYMLYNRNDRFVGKSLELYGEYSEEELQFLKQGIRPGDTVLDVGANIGAHTLFFAKSVGPAGVVLAFEPQRVPFQTLCANMALNGLINVICHHTAIGDRNGTIAVPCLDYEQAHNYGGVELVGDLQGEAVPLRTIDDFGLTRCNLIKVDVEGMEEAVLRGARDTIRRLKPVLYVENDRKEKSAQLISYIGSLGYRMYWHLPRLFNPDNYFANPENVFGNFASANMLCVHADAAVGIEGLRPVTGPDSDWRVS
jgi:FkbM family methyltransferase